MTGIRQKSQVRGGKYYRAKRIFPAEKKYEVSEERKVVCMSMKGME
jgi:hypothetical protein